MNNFKNALETQFLPFVEKPLRYLGNELNIIHKDLTKCSSRGVLCFPDLYDLGMSHYGSQILYHIVNGHDLWALSRCYHPAPDAETRMRETNLPLWDLEYLRPIREADWIGFTVQYELQYTNILNMLDLAQIPLRHGNRTEKDPIVVAGGPCMINPEPLAPFIDAFVIGDGEEVIETLCRTMEQSREAGLHRAFTLGKLAEIEGVYVPSSVETQSRGGFIVPVEQHKPVNAAKIPHLDSRYYPEKPLVPIMNVVHDRLAVEVMRGCTRGCRYCSAGMYYRPVRERDAGDILSHISSGVKNTGLREIGLLSLSTADYSGLNQLLTTAESLRHESHLSISLPSTRIDALDENQIQKLNKVVPASSMTIAPEAGSQRLRNSINKDFSEEAILQAVDTLLQNNIQTLKLYFMIGLPTEDSPDIEEMIALVKRIADMARKRGKRRTVNVAISPFSPKPQTPFQWEAMDTPERLLQKGRHIKFSLKNLRNVRVSYRDPYMTLLETVMARGDRAVADVIERAWQKGARFDGWDEHFNIDRWQEAATEADCPLDTYTGAIAESQKLPWSSVSMGIPESFFLEEKNKAIINETTQDCRTFACTACGVCDIAAMDIKKQHHITSDTQQVEAFGKTSLRSAEKPSFYRLSYCKKDQARFVAHRDMINAIERAFTMSKVPLAYSEGFHPHPRLGFGPPLSLGVAGDSEMMDAVLIREYQWDLDGINHWLPEGIRITGVNRLEKKPVSLNADIVAGRYVLTPPEGLVAKLAEIVEGALKQETIIVRTTKKGQELQKDIRHLIHSIEPIAQNPDHPGQLSCVVSMLPGKTCRVDELVSGLFPGYSPAHCYVRRSVCYRRGSDGLEALGTARD